MSTNIDTYAIVKRHLVLNDPTFLHIYLDVVMEKAESACLQMKEVARRFFDLFESLDLAEQGAYIEGKNYDEVVSTCGRRRIEYIRSYKHEVEVLVNELILESQKHD